MFIGEYQHGLDDKGRLALPVKFRPQLAKGVVITRGVDGCLVAYPKAEWTVLAQKLAALSVAQANTRAFARLLLAGAMDMVPDKQGRVTVPEYLRQYAGIAKNVVVAGLYNRMEIWDATAWAAYRKGTEKDAQQIAEQLGDLGV